MDNNNNESNLFAQIVSKNNDNSTINKEKQIESKMVDRSKTFKQKSYSNHIEETESNIINLRQQNREDLFAQRRAMVTKDNNTITVKVI